MKAGLSYKPCRKQKSAAQSRRMGGLVRRHCLRAGGAHAAAFCWHRREAIALIFVLWLTAILSLLAASVLLSVRMEVRSSALQEDEIKAYYLARAGIAHALHLLSTDEMSFDSYNDQWAFIDSEQAGMLSDVGRYVVRVEDESGKLNVNIATRDELVNFFGDEALADAIIDWRDEDDISQTHGAEVDWYLSSGLPYKPRNAPFETLHELLLVRGMTVEGFYAPVSSISIGVGEQTNLSLRDCLTTYSAVPNVMPDGSPLINLNRASAEEMKRALGDVLTDEEIEAILRYRTGATQQGAPRPPSQQRPTETGQPTGQPPAPSPAQPPQRPTTITPPTSTPFGTSVEGTVPQGGIQPPQFPQRRAAIPQPFAFQPGAEQAPGGMMQQQGIGQGAPQQGAQQSVQQGLQQSMQQGAQQQAGESQQVSSSTAFRSLADLFSVPGVSADKVRQIIDRVTIWDGRARYNAININTAPVEVLMSIPGMTEGIANDIVAFRQHSGAFESLAQLLDLPSVDERSFRQLVDKVSVRTQVFRIVSVGWMRSGARYVIECVVERLLSPPETSEEQGVEVASTGAPQQSSNASRGNVIFVVRYWRER